jgi:hypothetical protein
VSLESTVKMGFRGMSCTLTAKTGMLSCHGLLLSMSTVYAMPRRQLKRPSRFLLLEAILMRKNERGVDEDAREPAPAATKVVPFPTDDATALHFVRPEGYGLRLQPRYERSSGLQIWLDGSARNDHQWHLRPNAEWHNQQRHVLPIESGR